jgi:predicted nucleic acid-binding protein
MYLDSAIIVKLVVREPDSLFYTQELQGKTGIWTSGLAMTECYSALCRKEREKAVTRSVRNTAWAKIEEFIENGGIGLVTPTQGILANANRVIELCHPAIVIRSLDAIHLASCEHTGAWPLYSNDERIRKAAKRLKIPLGPVPIDYA